MSRKQTIHYSNSDIPELKIGGKHIYYNIDIVNTVNRTYKEAKFEEYRSKSIVGNQKDYRVNLVRAKFSLSYLPICIFPVIPNPSTPSDVNYGEWNFTILNIGTNVYTTRHVVYIPFDSTAVLPPPPVTGQQQYVNTEYYFVYSYNYLVSLLNTTLETINTAAGTGLPPPYFEYSDGLFSIIFHKDFQLSYRLFWNSAFELIFGGGFPVVYDGVFDGWKLYSPLNILTPYEKPQIGVVQSGIPDYYKLTQEFLYTPQYLSPLNRIVVKSSSLKARQQLVQSASQILSNTENSSSDNSEQILFSLSPDNTNPGVSQDIQNYYSASFLENNITDLLGDGNLNYVDFSVWWQDNLLNLRPLYLGYKQSISILLLFTEI